MVVSGKQSTGNVLEIFLVSLGAVGVCVAVHKRSFQMYCVFLLLKKRKYEASQFMFFQMLQTRKINIIIPFVDKKRPPG